MRDYVGYVRGAGGEEREFHFSCPKEAPSEAIDAAGFAAMRAQGLIDWWYVAADGTIDAPQGRAAELHCAACGCDMVWPHPQIDDLYVSSSCYIPGCELCCDCMAAHCNATNCAECGMKKGNPCAYARLIEE